MKARTRLTNAADAFGDAGHEMRRAMSAVPTPDLAELQRLADRHAETEHELVSAARVYAHGTRKHRQANSPTHPAPKELES